MEEVIGVSAKCSRSEIEVAQRDVQGKNEELGESANKHTRETQGH